MDIQTIILGFEFGSLFFLILCEVSRTKYLLDSIIPALFFAGFILCLVMTCFLLCLYIYFGGPNQ